MPAPFSRYPANLYLVVVVVLETEAEAGQEQDRRSSASALTVTLSGMARVQGMVCTFLRCYTFTKDTKVLVYVGYICQ